jgi:epoxyqueuosine reductase QueG
MEGEYMDKKEIKNRLYQLGADLCGIASIDRFQDAPEGFHPKDVLPNCYSVIVFANRFLAGTLACNTTVPYTIIRNILSDRMDKIAVQFCTDLEKEGILAIPTGTIGPTEFDKIPTVCVISYQRNMLLRQQGSVSSAGILS